MERKGKGEGKGMKAYHDETYNLPSVYMFLELFEVIDKFPEYPKYSGVEVVRRSKPYTLVKRVQ